MISSNDSFLFLDGKSCLGQKMIFFCAEKFYISNLGSTGMAVLRDVCCGMWDDIALELNQLEKSVFKVTSRSVSDQYGVLVKKYRTKWNEEEKIFRYDP